MCKIIQRSLFHTKTDTCDCCILKHPFSDGEHAPPGNVLTGRISPGNLPEGGVFVPEVDDDSAEDPTAHVGPPRKDPIRSYVLSVQFVSSVQC